ncbi:glycosyltransferase family 2 protein [Clostridium perfringens]|uniref:glycosyltransferase family 2 protein n=1 Tax=Clostridium perfringens TaxID=1502 RepID=UPI001A24D7A2|nr:glycosyltransferase family 2 protein [Clostridium perfringens]HAT4073169.1 glycosyltransferase family 2 protein [Clostridium perfringens]
MKKNMLSIIVPAYNAEKSICRCIDSILKTSYKNYEVLIINDKSIDNTLEKLKSNYEIKNNIRIIDLNENKGVSYCRNLGVKEAKGEYITFVDADDYISENMYSNMMKLVEEYDLDCCVCDYIEVFPNGNTVKSKYSYKNKLLNNETCIREYLTDRISPAVWDKIFKKSILERVLFQNRLSVGEDILFCLNIFKLSDKVYTLNEEYYYYEQQEASVMHVMSPKFLQFKEVENYISEKDLKFYVESFEEEIKYFKSAMYMRGIHTITSLVNNENKKEALKYLYEFKDKRILKDYIKNKYSNKFIKIEVINILVLGFRIHIKLSPYYVKARKIIRKS